MRAWATPSVPSLAAMGLGHGPALQLHDTASDGPVRLAPETTARMYVCGITPYDATHLGHAATYVAFDIAQRVWRDAGLSVHLHAEHHRHRRPAAGAGGARRRRLARARQPRGRALSRRHGEPAGAPPRPVHRGHRGDRPGGGAGPTHAQGRGDVRAGRRRLLRRPCGPAVPGTRPRGRGHHAHALRRAGRRPRPAGQAAPAGLPAVAGPTPPASRPGSHRSAPVVPAGTPSARPSRSTSSAWASRCRAVAATWSFHTTR